MIHRALGRCGVRVSALALGTVNFGWVCDEAESVAILDRAVDLGVDLVDTADAYNGGESERILGRWLAQDPARRDRIVLATKVYRATGDGPNDAGLSARHIRRACEESLRRLRTDHLDLYQMHHVDRDTPWEEVWQAMDRLVTEGKVLYVGSSNLAGWHIAMAHCHAVRRNVLGLACEQSQYNLASRHVELEVLPACEALRMGFLAYSPLAEGLLARTGDGAGGVRRVHTADRAQAVAEQLRRYAALCDEIGETPAVVALAWVLGRSGVTAALLGARTPSQLDDAVRALTLTLGPAEFEALDAIWPGPGGPAPEAYAW